MNIFNGVNMGCISYKVIIHKFVQLDLIMVSCGIIKDEVANSARGVCIIGPKGSLK